jgi:hypothetical protein
MNTQTIDPPPSIKPSALPAWHCVAFNAEIEDMLSLGTLLSPLALWLQADMDRAFAESGMLLKQAPASFKEGAFFSPSMVVGHLNWLSCCFFIGPQLQKGLSILESELKRTGLFVHCEFGWSCPDELIWRRYYPESGGDTFTPLLFSRKKPANTPVIPVTPVLRRTMERFIELAAPALAPQKTPVSSDSAPRAPEPPATP